MSADQRVHWRRLSGHPTEKETCLLNGHPFTGVAFDEWVQEGVLKSEWTFRDGRLWGPQRAWAATGQLGHAWFAVAGVPHGVSRLWWRNGRLAELVVFRYGVEVRARVWHKQGSVHADRTLAPGSPGALEIQRREVADEGRTADKELPAEFRDVVEGEWGAPPPEGAIA